MGRLRRRLQRGSAAGNQGGVTVRQAVCDCPQPGSNCRPTTGARMVRRRSTCRECHRNCKFNSRDKQSFTGLEPQRTVEPDAQSPRPAAGQDSHYQRILSIAQRASAATVGLKGNPPRASGCRRGSMQCRAGPTTLVRANMHSTWSATWRILSRRSGAELNRRADRNARCAPSRSTSRSR